MDRSERNNNALVGLVGALLLALCSLDRWSKRCLLGWCLTFHQIWIRTEKWWSLSRPWISWNIITTNTSTDKYSVVVNSSSIIVAVVVSGDCYIWMFSDSLVLHQNVNYKNAFNMWELNKIYQQTCVLLLIKRSSSYHSYYYSFS